MNRDFSKRAQDIITNPRYGLKNGEENELFFLGTGVWGPFLDKKNVEIAFWGECSKENGELKKIYHNSALEGLPLAWLDVFCHLALKRDRLGLLKMTIREIESYLRDENHRPAWDEAFFGKKEQEQLLKLRFVLIAGIGQWMALKEGHQTFQLKKEEWRELTLVLKIKTINELLEAKIRPSLKRDQGDVELLNIMGDHVYLKALGRCAGCQGMEEGTAKFIKNALSEAVAHDLLIYTC